MSILGTKENVSVLLDEARTVFEKDKRKGRTKKELSSIRLLYERTRSLIFEVFDMMEVLEGDNSTPRTQEELKFLYDVLDNNLRPTRKRLYGILYYYANKKEMLERARDWEIENKEKRRNQPSRLVKSNRS